MTAWGDMRHDLVPLGGFDDERLRYKLSMWFTYYWWPTRRWMPRLSLWWGYNVRRYPKPPPFVKDRIAHHHGFVDGIPACTDGPTCAEHGWRISPLVARQSPAPDQPEDGFIWPQPHAERDA